MTKINRRTASGLLIGLWAAIGLPLAASTRRSMALARLKSSGASEAISPPDLATLAGQDGDYCGDGGDGGDNNCNYYYGDGNGYCNPNGETV